MKENKTEVKTPKERKRSETISIYPSVTAKVCLKYGTLTKFVNAMLTKEKIVK